MYIIVVLSTRALSSCSRLSNSKRSASVIAKSSRSSIRLESVELWCACGSSGGWPTASSIPSATLQHIAIAACTANKEHRAVKEHRSHHRSQEEDIEPIR